VLGTGAHELANGLATLSSCLGERLQRVAIYLVALDGTLQTSGGAVSRDPGMSFAAAEGGGHGTPVKEAPVQPPLVLGQCPDRELEQKLLCDYMGVPSALLVVTADHDAGAPDALVEFLGELSVLIEARMYSEYETEDTTSHLLSLFEQIRAIHDLADSLPDCVDLPDVAELCLRSLLIALGAHEGYLFMRTHPDLPRVQVFGLEGDGGTLSSEEMELDLEAHGAIERALIEGQQSYGRIDPELHAEDPWIRLGQQSYLCIPVSFGSEERRQHIGCFLVLDREHQAEEFGNPDAEIVQSVGVLVGLVVGTKQREHAQNQLRAAHEIQKTLLPKDSPDWRGLRVAGANRSANQVGGDYFDYLETGWGGRLCLIADVSGHDMASAMAMVMGRQELRGAASRQASPGEMLSAVAASMFDDLSRNELFLTVFCLSFEERAESGSWRVRWANAGHNPPIVLRQGGGLDWLDDGGPMIGFMPVIDYADEELRLEPGDVVLLYTDGVTEAPDKDGKFLDEDGLVQILEGVRGKSAPEILRSILHAVDERSGDGWRLASLGLKARARTRGLSPPSWPSPDGVARPQRAFGPFFGGRATPTGEGQDDGLRRPDLRWGRCAVWRWAALFACCWWGCLQLGRGRILSGYLLIRGMLCAAISLRNLGRSRNT
jgi:serine phosphatase RsbU (regulator of sigma subunit)